MAMISVGLLAVEMGVTKSDVRRIGRKQGYYRYKDAKVELYDTNDWEEFTDLSKREKLSKRVLTVEHEAKLQGCSVDEVVKRRKEKKAVKKKTK
jgi:hypothetical protein